MPILFSTVLHKKISIGSSAYKTHLPVTLSNNTHTPLVFLNIFIGFLLNSAYTSSLLYTLTHNTLCSTQPAYLHSLLNYHTPTRSLRSANTNLLTVPRVRALHLPCVVSALQPPLCGTRSHLAFATLPLPIPFVAFLKLTASSRLWLPPSGSPKCLRFGLWLRLCTLKILFTYLLTYLLTYLPFDDSVNYTENGISLIHPQLTNCSRLTCVFRSYSTFSMTISPLVFFHHRFRALK